MTTALLLFSALLGCQAEEALASAALRPAEEAPVEAADPAAEGAQPATESLLALRLKLDALPPRQLARARDAGVTLITNCPFNRGAAQVPLVMQRVLARHADPALASLKAGVDAHVAVLDQLGLSALPAPGYGDYLYMSSAGVVSGAELAASPDPVGLSLILMQDLPGLVQGYDDHTLDKIHQSGAVLGAATGDRWPLKHELEGFSREMAELMAEGSLSAAAFADLEALSGLLDEYVGHRC